VLEAPAAAGQVYDVGGPEVLRYVDMLKRAAVLQNRRALPLFIVPLLTPRLSSGWLTLVTDVDLETARNLIDSMTNEVVVRDGNAIRDLIPGEPMGYDDAVRLALDERAQDPQTAKADSAAGRSNQSRAE
jgi:uncharacterized protein YbjT (DUF2867 family)